ncbi:chorismate synthase [candidate division MSBL1 archaeon SCGC-AAA382F02]|uniref:Chorismate synthase n=1 Tax=candidate division MSBL1 archaeon SCGC-AAA382F02 TaxID=1698282 RepID=A0A133VJA4_9EURY|nr:chorismate synthase [candidate division MSBL1 archaeon SCGC-AAA382F02]
MGGNTFGKMFKITTFGESHGEAVGVVVDGVPAGLPLTEEDIQKDLDKRRPGKSEVETSREEKDQVKILSGVFEGKTVGTPILMLVKNKDVKSEKYEKRKTKPRPGHADLTYKLKYGHVDYRGGGRSSGRETVGRVAAGAIAKKILESEGIEVLSHVVRAAGVELEERPSIEDIRKVSENNSMRCSDPEVAEKMKEKVLEASEEGDSTGGIIEVLGLNIPAGLGEPVFDKLDAEITKALMSLGAVKGVEIGLGFEAAERKGSEVNDSFEFEENRVVSETNNAGGILGGISTGDSIIAKMAVKPTSSISKTQKTVDLESDEEVELELEGRFDPNICPRVAPVAEAMLALTLADFMLRSGKINPDKFEGAD